MECILIRYGEIALKSSWVRREFEKRLRDNISHALVKNKIKIEKVEKKGARIYVFCDKQKKALSVLKNVFGIVSYSPVKIIKSDLEEMKKEAVKEYKKVKGTFRITTRRNFKSFPFTSQQISEKVGEYVINKTGAKVKLKEGDIDINFEVHKDKTYLFTEIQRGPGGLPIGTQGRVICLFSSGIDSAVAAFQIMRKGCKITLVFADQGEFGNLKKKKQAIEIAKHLAKNYYFCDEKLKLIVVPFGHHYPEFAKAGKFVCILCKRQMYKIAEKIAEREEANAIISGESLGQVASQTLSNLRTLNSAVEIPVLRPLIEMDKDEIIRLAKKIGSYELSIREASECKAVPPKPATVSKISEIKQIELRIDMERLIEKSVKNLKTFEFD